MTLIESGVTGLTLTLTIEDLKAFATDMIEQAKAQLLPVMVSASQESCIPKKEVLEMFGRMPHDTLELGTHRLSCARQDEAQNSLPPCRR